MKEKLMWFVVMIVCSYCINILDRNVEKIMFVFIIIFYQAWLFIHIDNNQHFDTPMELVGKVFIHKGQKYKILWYRYGERETFGVMNIKTKVSYMYEKQELYKAIEIDDEEAKGVIT